MSIKHVWFDFSETIGTSNKEQHNILKYKTFAQLRGVEDTPEMRAEYAELYEKHGRSNANLFAAEFDIPPNYWGDIIARESANGLYMLKANNIPRVLIELVEIVPVSIFSSIDAAPVLKSLGIDPKMFTNILSASELTKPKPNPEGYNKIVELSSVPAQDILYVGDDEMKDIIPASSVGLQTGIMWSSSDLATFNFSDFVEVLDLVKSSH